MQDYEIFISSLSFGMKFCYNQKCSTVDMKYLFYRVKCSAIHMKSLLHKENAVQYI